MSDTVKVTVYTDDGKSTAVDVPRDEVLEYENMAFTSDNITCVSVDER